MGIELLLKGILAGWLVSIPLGPVGVLCIQRTINKGRLAGFISGLGATFADTIFAVIAGLGITFIVKFIEEKQVYFQTLGGIIVIIIGINLFVSSPVKQYKMIRRGKHTILRDLISVFFLTFSNPLTILFFIAFFAGVNLASGTMEIEHVGMMVLGVASGSASWWFLLSGTVSLFRNRVRLKNIWWINKVTGVLLFVIGLGVIASVFIVRAS
ncbi:MAG: LysE family translocator [Bacteroidota bacterium]